jgi:hypothetical protein
MAFSDSSNVTFELDSTAGGTLADYTSQLDQIGDFDMENPVIENTPFGATAVERAFINVVDGKPLTIGGEIDDTAGSLWKVLKAAGGSNTTRSMKLTALTGEYVSCEVLVQKPKRKFSVKNRNRFECQLHPTGAVTES